MAANNKFSKYIIAFLILAFAIGMMADDITPVRKWLPGEVKDTTELASKWRAKTRRSMSSRINVLHRAYGDSIVLRWAPDDYVTWKFLCRVGVDIIRTDMEEMKEDTLVMKLLPYSLEEFQRTYGDTDSLAGLAMGSLYNQKALRPVLSTAPIGGMESLYEIHQEQQMAFGMGVLVSELRPDLADHLQMRFVDSRLTLRGTSPLRWARRMW